MFLTILWRIQRRNKRQRIDKSQRMDKCQMSVPRAWTLNSHPTLTVRRCHERPCPTRDSQLLNLLTFLPKSMSMPSTGSIRIDWCIGLLMPLLSLRKGIAVLSNCFTAVKKPCSFIQKKNRSSSMTWEEKAQSSLESILMSSFFYGREINQWAGCTDAAILWRVCRKE